MLTPWWEVGMAWLVSFVLADVLCLVLWKRGNNWKWLYEIKKTEADAWRQSANGYLTVDLHKRAKAAKALDDIDKSVNAARVALQLGDGVVDGRGKSVASVFAPPGFGEAQASYADQIARGQIPIPGRG